MPVRKSAATSTEAGNFYNDGKASGTAPLDRIEHAYKEDSLSLKGSSKKLRTRPGN